MQPGESGWGSVESAPRLSSLSCGIQSHGRDELLRNHCDRCGSLQGDFFLHEEPGGAFVPMNFEQLARIAFMRIDGRIRCDGDVCYGVMDEAFELWSGGSTARD